MTELPIIDDNFIGNIEWTDIFVQAIKKMNLVWHAAVSTNIFYHKDLIRKFAESGCKSLLKQ
jgi:hypothetical protein